MRASAVDAGADAGRDALTMRGAAALAYAEAALDALEGTLAGAPDWRPGRALRAEVAWCRERLGELTEAWGSKLVVAIVGPSGGGQVDAAQRPRRAGAIAHRADAPDARVVVYAAAEA